MGACADRGKFSLIVLPNASRPLRHVGGGLCGGACDRVIFCFLQIPEQFGKGKITIYEVYVNRHITAGKANSKLSINDHSRDISSIKPRRAV